MMSEMRRQEACARHKPPPNSGFFPPGALVQDLARGVDCDPHDERRGDLARNSCRAGFLVEVPLSRPRLAENLPLLSINGR